MKPERILLNYKKNKVLYWMILPVLAYVCIFNYLPMFGLTMAFQNYSITGGIFGSKWIWFDNFVDFFRGLYFQRTLTNTLLISLYTLLFAFPAPIIFALMLNEVRHTGFKRVVQSVSYMPHFISMIVVVSMINDFTNSNGVIASVVSALGGTPRNYASDPASFRSVFVISEIWQEIGFNSIIYLSALSGINEELYEAAEIDGAGRIARLFHVTIPGIASVIIIMLILRCGALMTVNFEKLLLMYSPATYETADVIQTYVYRIGIIKQKIGYSTAVGLFNSVVGLILIVLANNLSRKYTEVSMF
jgi:putative aldouronate transport system permease protein